MIYSGVTSITFRDRSVEDIIEKTRQAGLDAIEWGGDIHVPHGDYKTAEKVGQATRDAGLTVSSYGSYYRAGESEEQGLSFDSVLDTAEALQVPMIRIWAGGKKCGSHQVTEDYREYVTKWSA